MSSSTAEPAAPIWVQIWTQEAATEVNLVDGQFHLLGHAFGHLEMLVAPGIYKIQLRAGNVVQEERFALRPGDPPLYRNYPPLSFASPTLLADTARTHEYQIGAAASESRQTHAQRGTGSAIYVFARDWTAPGPPRQPGPAPLHPARGLSLRDAGGTLLVDFSTAGEVDLRGDPWAACNVAVDPGSYRLHLDLATGASLDQTVVASPGWQTQVFLLQRAYSPDDRRADLPGAAVLMAPGAGFDPGQPDMRLAELARLGLANGRQVLPPDEAAMLTGKFENPMLGIYAAHLLLLAPEYDRALLRTVVDNLRGLVGQHPDVEALALALPGPPTPYTFTMPPMLRRSWAIVPGATIARPDLVPVDSVAAQIAPRLWGAEPWLTWQTPPGAAAGLTPAEQQELSGALQTHLATPDPLESTGVRGLGPPAGGPWDAAAAERLVRVFGLPRATLEGMARDLGLTTE